MNLKEALEYAGRLARLAGKLQLENWGRTDLAVDTKASAIDLVTTIDRQSEALILRGLQDKFPDHAFLAEESAASGSKLASYRWVIDPLDGTTNYAQGLPIFTVSIALEHNGQAVLGVVYAPVTGELFTALRGEGAYCNGRPLRVSDKAELINSVLATGFPYDVATHGVNNVDYFADLLLRVRGIRRFGSAAYDLACVASGRFDGYWELGLSPWDVAAGCLLVEEAGGVIVPFRTDRKVSLIAGNVKLCELIRQALDCVEQRRG